MNAVAGADDSARIGLTMNQRFALFGEIIRNYENMYCDFRYKVWYIPNIMQRCYLNLCIEKTQELIGNRAPLN